MESTVCVCLSMLMSVICFHEIYGPKSHFLPILGENIHIDLKCMVSLKKNGGMVVCINIGKKENPGYLTNVIYVKSFVGPVLFKLMSDVVKFFLMV